jgi:hypothetical protein
VQTPVESQTAALTFGEMKYPLPSSRFWLRMFQRPDQRRELVAPFRDVVPNGLLERERINGNRRPIVSTFPLIVL